MSLEKTQNVEINPEIKEEKKEKKEIPDNHSEETEKSSTQIFPKRDHFGSDGKKYCAYGGSVTCTQRPMRGYEFCVKHILQDPTSPFRQCSFLSKQTKKRCTNPVTISQEDTRYCNSHKQMLGILPKSAQYSKKKKKGVEKEKKNDSDTEVEGPTKKRILTNSDSETESDFPTSDEEFIESTPNLHQLRNVEQLTEEEFLLLRKERIESLLNIYYKQYKKLKTNLKLKYNDFIKQREKIANQILGTKDIKVGINVDEHDEEEQEIPKIEIKKKIYSYSRVEKHDQEGNILCYYGNCTEKRILECDFCFKHILFEPNQWLYQEGPKGEFDPVLSGTIFTEKEKKKKTTVTLDEPKKKKKKIEDKTKIQPILEVLPKVQNQKIN